MRKQDTAKAEAIAKLRDWLKPGDTVFTLVRSVSASGMSRTMDLYVIREGEPLRVTWSVCDACGFTYDRKREALKVSGCGMDMGFHVVYSLSRVLFADGFTCAGDKCPSNDHSNGDRDYTPHHHSDPGYALRQRWM